MKKSIEKSFNDLRVFFMQTSALYIKNIFSSIVYIPDTLVRLLIPAFFVIFVYLLKIALIGKTNNYNTHTVKVTTVSTDNGPILYSTDESIHYEDSIIYDMADRVADKLGLDNDKGPGDAGYTYFNYKSCGAKFCKISDCSMLQSILAIANDTSTSFSGAFCLIQDEKVEYKIYRDETTKNSNPYNLGYLPIVKPYDYSTNLQRIISVVAIELNSQEDSIPLDNFVISTQEPLIQEVQYDTISSLFGPSFFFAALFLAMMNAHYELNKEKNEKLRQGMETMGLTNCSFWTSWFLYQSTILLIGVVLMMIAGYSCQIHIISRTDPITIFLAFFITGLAILSNFMCCSTVCSKPVITTLNVFTLLTFSVGFTLMWIDTRFVLLGSNIMDFISVDSMLPNIFTSGFLNFFAPGWLVHLTPSFSFGKLMWDILEKTHDNGLGDSDTSLRFGFVDMFNFTIHPQPSFPLFNWWTTAPFVTMIILFGIFLIYVFLTYYFDNVLPRENYRAKPFYFLLSPHYWGIGRSNDYLQVDTCYAEFNKEGFVLPSMDEDILDEFRVTMNSLVTDRDNINVPLKIIKVSKMFSKWYNRASSIQAVSDMTLSCEKGKCLVLCGHNGAGKTTLINILTGNISPSSGDALIFGSSISLNIGEARRKMGVCPQHDIIWPYLTVSMHMYLFACLKGIPLKKQKGVIDDVLNKVMLLDKKSQQAKTLSGGQKRRLSLAMAIMGDPQILFLDEPTSGMDPCVRRKMWNLIAELKKDRLIVLTTHSMEEADSLGDKICIMANGSMRCVGDSLHLKNKFGSGYQVDVILSNKMSAEQFKEEVQKNGAYVNLEKQAESSLTFSIPHNIGESALKFFEFVEKQNSLENVRDYTISHTTLEDVFITTTHGSKKLLENLKRRENGVTMNKMTVTIKGKQEPLCDIDIANNWTLKDIRLHISNNILTDGSVQFVFIEGDEPISNEREDYIMASDFLPLLMIKEISPVRAPMLINEEHETTITIQERGINIEEEQKKIITQQKKEIEEKNKEIDRLNELVSMLRQQYDDVMKEKEKMEDNIKTIDQI